VLRDHARGHDLTEVRTGVELETLDPDNDGAVAVEHLAPGVSVDGAVDVYLTLVLPEVYRTLVLERGWTAGQFETWLAQALTSQLLGHPPHAT
jgi:hypothetical protein